MNKDEELNRRFIRQKLDDLLNNCTKPWPTIICEQERQEIQELIRKNCLYARTMVPFKVRRNLILVYERLEVHRDIQDYGDLYILVSIN